MSDSQTIKGVYYSEEHFQEEDVNYSKNTDSNSFLEGLRKITTISKVLHFFGAFGVLVSMSLFLFNGWSEGNDIQRYFKLLGQTGLLTASGLILSFCLKENKGARLFFGLSLTSVVANFTILGALIYSIFQFDDGLSDYPSMMTWSAADVTTFLPVFLGSAVFLSILTRFSFSIFARNIAVPLSLSFLGMSSLLLIPVRSSLAVSIIAAGALLLSTVIVKRMRQNENIVLTPETKFALSLIFVPGFLIFARALSLYSIDEVLLLTLNGLIFLSIRVGLTSLSKASTLKRVLEKSQFLVGILLSLQFTDLLPSDYFGYSGLIFSIVIMVFSFDQIKISKNHNWKKLLLDVTSIGVVVANAGFAFFSDSLLLQISSLLACVGLFFFAKKHSYICGGNRFSKLIALIGIMSCLLMLVIDFVFLIDLSNWMLIGLSGVLLIVGGSLFERFGLSLFSDKR